MTKIVIPDPPPFLPDRLQQGDTIGLFCPAGPIRNLEHVEEGIRCLQEMGFTIKLLEKLQVQGNNDTYLAASDATRARGLHALWADKEVKALMAVRGGYGCLRILDQLDFNFFRANPKLLIGFSDLTALLAANFTTTGLIGLHGPVVSSLAQTDTESQDRLYSLLTGSYLPYFLEDREKVLRPGAGTGPIIAGNLTTLTHLIGTPWEPALTGSILLIEDTGEPMYRIDRLLTHLGCSGRLADLAGLIFGSFDSGNGQGTVERLQDELFERITQLTDKYNYPIWVDFPIGHLTQNQAIFFGMKASMDSEQAVLTLLPDVLTG